MTAFHRVSEKRPRAPDESDETFVLRKTRAGFRHSLPLKLETGDRLRVRPEVRDRLRAQQPMQSRRRIVAETEAERFEGKEQIAKQYCDVEVEILDRAHRHFRRQFRILAECREVMFN